MEPLSHRRLWALSALAALADFLFGATYVYVMLSAGLSGGTIGTLLAVSVIVSTLLDAPSGAWGDRFGQRRVIVAGLAVWGAGMLLFSLATRPLGYAPALVLWSAGMVVYSSAPMALFGCLVDPAERDARLDTAVRGAQVLRWLAAALGALGVALVGSAANPRVLTAVSGLVVLALAGWVRASWPESAPLSREQGTWRTLAQAAASLRRPALLTNAALDWLLTACLAVIVLSWQPVALARFGTFGLRGLGACLFFLSLGAAAGGWVSRYVPGRAARGGALAAVLGLEAVLTLVGGSGAALTAGAYIAAEFLFGLAVVLVSTRAQQLYPNELRNTLGSLTGTVAGLVMSASDFALGRLWSAYGIEAAVRWAAVALLAATVPLAVVEAALGRRGRAARPGPGPEPGPRSELELEPEPEPDLKPEPEPPLARSQAS